MTGEQEHRFEGAPAERDADADAGADAGPDAGGAPAAPAPDAATTIHDPMDQTTETTRLEQLIDAEASPTALAREAERLDAPDAAETLAELEPEHTAKVIDVMDDGAAAEMLAHMPLALAATILDDLTETEAATYLALMSDDDAADLLQQLEAPRRNAILRAMPRRQAATLGKLALYDPETAGGLMSTELFAIFAEKTVQDALDLIRRHGAEITRNYVYCLTAEGRLAGVVSLRELLMADPAASVAEIMTREVTALHAQVDQEEVADVFQKYDFTALPVVDQADRLLGVITIDDVVDIIQEEATEDVFKQVGAGVREMVTSPLGEKIRSRLPWLMVNLLTASAAAAVVFQFEGLIREIAFLAVLMPIIANQAGNAGHQSLAVTLRGLVLGQVKRDRVPGLLLRETGLGLATGLATGAAMGLAILLLSLTGVIHTDARVAVVAFGAMTGALGVGCLMGAGMPLLMDKLGFDPATASSIFLTMLTDAAAFAAFLGLAWALQGWLLGGPVTV